MLLPLLKVYIVGGSDGFFISAVDRVMVIDLGALGEGFPCLYRDESHTNWWTHYNTGAMGRFPYRKQFLQDDEAHPKV